MDYLQIGNTKIEYDLQYSGRRNSIELVIDLTRGFKVTAPEGMSHKEIIRHLHRKEKWIINNLDRMSEIIKYESKKEFVSGEKFLLRGRRYWLKVKTTNKEILPCLEFKKSRFHALVPKIIPESDYHKLIRPLFIHFYKQKADKIINKRVKRYLKYFKKKPTKVTIQSLKDKWGSCSKGNQIRYNWRIVLAKTTIIDYVIVHELCHLVVKNHSDKYWKEVKRILPDYQKYKDWLRVNGESLNI